LCETQGHSLWGDAGSGGMSIFADGDAGSNVAAPVRYAAGQKWK
jgi:hypothetical protein